MDFKVYLNETLLQKIVKGARYPIDIYNYDVPFPRKKMEILSEFERISQIDVNNLIDVIYKVPNRTSEIYNSLSSEERDEVESMIKSVYNELIQGITNCIDSYDNVTAEKYDGLKLDDFEWPEGFPAGNEGRKKMMELKLLEPNVILKEKSILGISTHLRWASVSLEAGPSVSILKNMVKLDAIELRAGARVEIWTSYNWYNCYKWCTKWETVKKWKYVAFSKTGLDITSVVEIPISSRNNIVVAGVNFKSLKLNWSIIKLFDLAPFANSYLKNKVVEIFDGNKFVQTIPLLSSAYKVSNLEISVNDKIIETSVDVVEV
jgi:hypothetical protein